MASAVLLRRLLGTESRGAPDDQQLVGIEHEFQTHAGSGQHDFRLLIDAVAGPVLLGDPGDPRARRLESGLSLTADGWEAELVTPPVPLVDGAPQLLARMLAQESGRLLAALKQVAADSRLTGFSTHINLSVPDRIVVTVAREFAVRYAPATMLLLDRPGSPGLLVRPRRGRLEIGGEYVSGEDLAAVVTFVAAAVGQLTAPAEFAGELATPGSWRIEPARERFGHFVPADGVAADLYARGRRSRFPHGGREVSGQQHLETVWAAVRPTAIAIGLDPTPVDRRVAGFLPLPLEHGQSSSVPVPADTDPALDVLDPATLVRRRGTVTVEPAWLTWTTVAWRCHDARRDRVVHLVMPVSDEARFLERLDAGRLDTFLRMSMRPRLRAATLTNSAQSTRPGVWSTMRPESLVPAERGADGIPMSGGSGAGAGQGSEAKERHDEADPAQPDKTGVGPPRRRARLVGLVAAGLVILGGGAAALAINGPDGPAAPGTPPTVATPTASDPQEPNPGADVDAAPASDPGAELGGSVEFVGTFTSACDPAVDCDVYVADGVQATLDCAGPRGQSCTLTLDGRDGYWSPLPALTRIGESAFTGEELNICDRPDRVQVELAGSVLRMEQVGESDPGANCYSGTNTFEGEFVTGSLSDWTP